MDNVVSIAFVLRFWFEPREIEGVAPIWRGVVELIPSGERYYFEKLEDLPSILRPFLKNTRTSNP